MPVLPAVPSTMVPPGRKRAARDGVLDDEQGGAVLDRLAGIEEFRLAENFAAGLFGGALEPDQRRVADRRDDVFLDAGHGPNLKGLRWLQPFKALKAFSARSRPAAKSTIGCG